MCDAAAKDAGVRAAPGSPEAASVFLVLQPVGDLCERLQAIVSAGIMAKDLGRQLCLLWKPDVCCNCPWERLFKPAEWLQVLDPAAPAEPEGPLQAAAEILCLWDMVCVASGHEDLLQLALERFNRAHWSHFHSGGACLVDPAAAKWRELPRFVASERGRLPDSLRAACVCIRAAGDFYPTHTMAHRGLDDLDVERALILQRLPLAPAIARQLQDVSPGTVSVDACFAEAGSLQRGSDEAEVSSAADCQLQPFEEAMDAFRDGLREMPRGTGCDQFLVATSQPDALRDRWSSRYAKIVTCGARASNRSVPQAVEDDWVGLLMLARGGILLTEHQGPRSDVVSLLGSVAVALVRPSSGADVALKAPEAPVHLLDPSEPNGPFFVAGSWDDWKEMKELKPLKGTGPQYEARVTAKGNLAVEFQLVSSGDWGRRFFPTEDGLIWGPDSRHGANWRVQVPEGCVGLKFLWDPRGQRSLQWAFLLASGVESWEEGAKMQSTPFFIAGSWDGWKGFTELSPGSAGSGPPYRAKIPVFGVVEFQIFRGRDWKQRFHPSAYGGKICGPSSGEGRNWRVEIPDGCKWLKVTWDPRGHKDLRWRFISHNDRVMDEAKPKQPAPELLLRGRGLARSVLPARVGNMDVPQRLGNWRLLSMLGKGYVGAVFRARPWCPEEAVEDADEAADDADEEVAVKYPALACEIDALRRCRKVEGVPSLLDEGYGPAKSRFCVIPVLGPSLKVLLKRCNHDGRGGRVSRQAAYALGVCLVRALRGIHGCGLVHCDVNPGNILFRMEDAEPQLIDFGWARNIGEAHFDKTVGTCMYNSIRAGFGGQRTPADDLESVGWLLLHCILGKLPWAERDEGVSAQQVEAWQRRSEGLSVAKELFLADRGIFGPEFNHCPPELASYLRLCQSAGPDPTARIDYRELARLLCDQDRSSCVKGHWSRVLEMSTGQLQTETVYNVPRGLICYRPAGKPHDFGTEKVCSIAKGSLIRTTGAETTCLHGGRWVEVDPLWAPKLPPVLLDFSWLLVAKVTLPAVPWDDDTEKNGPLLKPAGTGSDGS